MRAKREAVLGLVAGAATAGVQVLIGSGGSVDTLIAAVVGAFVAVVVFPLAELGLRWLQAPMKLLTEDVIANRERVEEPQAGLPPQPERAPAKEDEVQLTLAL